MSSPYSHSDFTGRDLTERRDMSGLTITGSCFSREIPDSDVFPPGMTGTTFIRCNLMNCKIPPGNTVGEHCQTQRFKVQNDLNDWEVDADNKPTRILMHKILTKRGEPLPDPRNLPTGPLKERIPYEKPGWAVMNIAGEA